MPATSSQPLACAGLAAVVLTCTCTGVAAQAAFAYNRLDFSNRVLTDRDDLFPGQATANGASPGDALFKVLPAEICERQGNHRISGYRLAVAVQRAYASFFPARVSLPAVQIYRTRIERLGGSILGVKEYETLDPTRPLSGTLGPIRVDLPGQGAYTIEVRMDPRSSDPNLRQLISVPALVNGTRAGLAIMALANPGESSASTSIPTAVLRPSYQERHLGRARDAYSGSYTASTGTIEMYGMLGQPSPRGELYLSLLFDNPTLTMYGSAAGGSPTHAAETGMGPGAFDTDLATSSVAREVGFFAHAEQYHVTAGQPAAMVPMIVSYSPSGPTTALALGNTHLRVSTSAAVDLGVLFRIGAWGFLTLYKAEGHAGFTKDKRGAWASPRFSQAPNAAWKGQAFWVQGVVVDTLGNFLDTTNVVRVSLD